MQSFELSDFRSIGAAADANGCWLNRWRWGAYVYRCYDRAGDLLYVGASVSIVERIGSHKVNAYWWPAVTRVVVDEHESPEAAFAAEREAIRAEMPQVNKVWSSVSLRDRLFARAALMERSAVALREMCEAMDPEEKQSPLHGC